jgi:homoserine O-acetyltransferase
MLGHITYLSPIAMADKFEDTRNQPRDIDTQFEKEFSVGSYLAYKGQQFTERFDANSYLVLSMAMDRFDLGGTVEQIAESFSRCNARWLVTSFSSDWLFPPFQSKQIAAALLHNHQPVTYMNVESSCGHDAFLLEEDLPTYGPLMEAFLANLLGVECDVEIPPASKDHQSLSIYHASRLDYDHILDLIPDDVSVLDVGCGNGGLLKRLEQRGHRDLHGLEIDEQNILACVRQGLDVIHRDLNKGLAWFTDRQFDVVTVSQTIQTILNVERVMDEVLRVGKQCIVSVPNFAYQRLIDMLLQTGMTPEAGLLHFKWYNTPNLRFLTIRDFDEFCRQKQIAVHRRIALNTEAGRIVGEQGDPNRNADMAIYVLSR